MSDTEPEAEGTLIVETPASAVATIPEAEQQAEIGLLAAQPPVVTGSPDTGWRGWVAQQGGFLPPSSPNTPFPGIGPILDYINPNQSNPSYYPINPATGLPWSGSSPYVPMAQNAKDPWNGWTAQATTMRPVVPGIN
jgi:hypothetical protein